MTAHLAPNRMSVPPPNVVGKCFVPARARATRAPSATPFVARVILAAIAFVMAATLVAIAPPTVMLAIAVVLSTGLYARRHSGSRSRALGAGGNQVTGLRQCRIADRHHLTGR